MSEPGVNTPQTESKEPETKDSGSQSDPLLGLLFENRYQILTLYGKGATASAYKAHDVLLQRDVALKIIHPFLASSPEAIQRFKNEAATSTALNHPNIAHVYNQGLASDGRLYIVMDCLEGESLAELIAREGKLELADFFQYFSHLIDALAYAHEQGVIHRDIKPNNIVIAREADLKVAILVDFGLAKFLGETGDQSSTRTGAMLGSSAYMSPEQCLGKGDVDQRSDIYSLGCVMLESLLGKSPFQGESALDVMYKHLNESISKLGVLKEIPEGLAKIIRKCLEKDPQNRYQSISALKTDFAALSEMQDTLQRRWKHKQKDSIQKRSISVLCFLLLVGAFALGFFYWSKSVKEKQIQETKNAQQLINHPVPKKLPAIETVTPRRKVDELNQQVYRYEEVFGPRAGVILNRRWLDRYESSADRADIADVYAGLVLFYGKLDDGKMAEFYLNKVLKEKNVGNALVGAVTAMKSYYTRNQMYDKIFALIDKLLKDFPAINESTDRVFHLHVLKAEVYREMHDDLNSIVYLKKALQNPFAREVSIPELNQNRYSLIGAYSRSGQKEKAKEIALQCQQSIELMPERKLAAKEVLDQLATAFDAGEDFPESIKYLKLLRNQFLEEKKLSEAFSVTTKIAGLHRELEQHKQAVLEEEKLLPLLPKGRERALLLSLISLDMHYTSPNDTKSLELARKCFAEINELLDAELGEPLNLKSLLLVEEPYLNCTNRLRDELSLLNRMAEARTVIEGSIKKLKNYPSPLLASLWLHQSCFFMNLHDPVEKVNAMLDETAALVSSPAYARLKDADDIKDRLSKIHLTKAENYDTQNDFQKALDECDRALVLENERKTKNLYQIVSIQLHRANDQAMLGQLELADKTYSECEKLCKRTHVDSSLTATEQLRQIAGFKRKVKKYSEAELLLSSCIKRLKNRYGEHARCLSQYYYDLAACIHDRADYAKSQQIVDLGMQNISLNKNEPLYLYKGFLYLNWDMGMRRRDFKAAEKAMLDAIAVSLDSEFARNYYQLSVVYANQNLIDKRIETLEAGLPKFKHLKNGVDICSYLVELGDIYTSINKTAKAKPYIFEAIKLAPSISDPDPPNCAAFKLGSSYYILGRIDMQDGKPADACKNFSAAADYFEKVKDKFKQNLKDALTKGIEAATAAHDEKTLQLFQSRLDKLD